MKYRSLFFLSLAVLLITAVNAYSFSQDSSSSLKVTTDLSSVQTTPGSEISARFQIVLQNFSWNHTHFTVELDNVLITTASGTNDISYDFNDGTSQGFQGDPFDVRIVPGQLEMWAGYNSSYYLQFDDDPDELLIETSAYVDFLLPYDCLSMSFVINLKQFGTLDSDAAYLEAYFVESGSEVGFGPEYVDPILEDTPRLITYAPFTEEFEFNPLYTILEETYAIPEPATIFMLLTSLAGLFRFIKHKK